MGQEECVTEQEGYVTGQEDKTRTHYGTRIRHGKGMRHGAKMRDHRRMRDTSCPITLPEVDVSQ